MGTYSVKLLVGAERAKAIGSLRAHHYAHSVSSGKSHFFSYGNALVVFSIPANKNIAKFLLGPRTQPNSVWELSRLWAPDHHEPNLLTAAISKSVGAFRVLEPNVEAIIAYADPNVGHEGYVYRAASWLYLGQCEESRYYVSPDGQVVSRRRFHSGANHLTKSQILALGYKQLRKPGKHRFARPLNKWARQAIEQRFGTDHSADPNP